MGGRLTGAAHARAKHATHNRLRHNRARLGEGVTRGNINFGLAQVRPPAQMPAQQVRVPTCASPSTHTPMTLETSPRTSCERSRTTFEGVSNRWFLASATVGPSDARLPEGRGRVQCTLCNAHGRRRATPDRNQRNARSQPTATRLLRHSLPTWLLPRH